MKRKFSHLSIEERHVIYEQRTKGSSLEQIGDLIGRSKSTVSTELKRNSKNGTYIPHTAQNKSDNRRHESGTSKIDGDINLRSYIVKQMKTHFWSPDVIAGTFRKSGKNKISTEAIYHWIYTSPWAIANKIYLYLSTRRSKRLPRISRKKRQMIPNRTSIHERDPVAQNKEELGHFEGDLTFHIGNKSRNIGAFVDKSCQKVFLTLNTSKRSRTVISGFIRKLKEVPVVLRKTIALDNGLEFYRHIELQLSGLKTYFCDPYSPNQKPLVEKMNAMIHRVLPKNTDIKTVTEEMIQNVENILNNMPRRILGYQTPNQVWDEKMKLCSI